MMPSAFTEPRRAFRPEGAASGSFSDHFPSVDASRAVNG